MGSATNHAGRGETLRRIGWLILIWVFSVTALGIVAFGMRMVMSLVGMTK